jgi:hypothetical protein
MANPLPTYAIFENHEWAVASVNPSELPSILRFATRCTIEAPHQRIHIPAGESAWRNLISSGDVVCAKTTDGRLAGVYATNQFTQWEGAEALQSARAARNVLCNRFRYSEGSVAFGAVALVERRLPHSEVRLRMLRELLRSAGYRYRCLFNVVEKTNQDEMNLLPAEGWRCFHEEDDTCYMMLDIAKGLRQLASSLVLPMQQRSAARAATL